MTLLTKLRALVAQQRTKPTTPVATTTELGAATETMQQLLHIRWWHWRMRFLVAKKLQLEEQTHESYDDPDDPGLGDPGRLWRPERCGAGRTEHTVAAWTAAVRAEDWEGATALMAGETAPWLRIMKATSGIAPWQTTTVVEGPTPVDGGQQYGLHWYREPASPEHQHRCSLIVLDDAGKIHATDTFVGCGQFEALK